MTFSCPQVNLTVTVSPNGSESVPACGDALDIRFVSHRGLFAPRIREVACGAHGVRNRALPVRQISLSDPPSTHFFSHTPVLRLSPPQGVHELSIHLPPDAAEYDADVYVVHINGEGMKDPAVPRPFPANLVNFNEGPDIYNLRAKCGPRPQSSKPILAPAFAKT